MTAGPEPFLKALAPSREDLVVGVACRFPGDWRADRCARAGMPCVLGPVRSMKAIHGGQAQHDPIDAPKMAVWLRGGLLPQAYVSPADRRATRDLRRRRMPRMRTRAARRAHLQQTHRPDNRPDIGTPRAYQANRDGVAERLPAPAVQQSLAGDLALSHHDDGRRGDLARSLLTTATPPQAQTRSRRRPGPGSGALLRRVLREESPDIGRCPRVQDCVADGRRVQCTQASAGPRYGPAGPTSGHASLQGACSAAAVLCRRTNPAGHTSRTTLATTPGQGQAFTRLAHTLGRAVSDRLKRHTACDGRRLLAGAWNGAGEPNASRDDPGLSRSGVLGQAWIAASLHAAEPRGPLARILWPLMGPPLRRRSRRRASRSVDGGGPAPAPGTHGRTRAVQPRLGVGRYEGTATFLGRRGRHHRLAALTISRVTASPDGCGADPWCLDRHGDIQPEHVARGRRRRDHHRGKKAQNPLLGRVCLLTTGGLPRN